jgi:cell division protein FtsW (lipid II flippase)
MFVKTLFKSFDWIQFLLVIALLGIGLTCVMSATHTDLQLYSYLFKKQLLGSFVGLFFYFFLAAVPLKTVSRIGYFAYGLAIALLGYTYCRGFVALGARRWISFYFFRMQPSELIKFLLTFFMGYFLY